MADGYWYHGNGKIGGEFHPNKPNDEEHYGEYVKIKHGRWMETEYSDYDDSYKCSACGEVWEFIEGTPKDNGANYCPNCGAKMDL